jgi:hypothetical protein
MNHGYIEESGFKRPVILDIFTDWRKKMKKYLLILFIVLVLIAGCSTTSTYQSPHDLNTNEISVP